MACAGRVEKKPWRLQGVAANDDCTGTLEVLYAFCVVVEHAVSLPAFIHRDVCHHAVVSDLRTMNDRVRNVGHQRGGLCAHFAALNAEAAINTMRTVTVGCGKNGDRAPRRDTNTQGCAALDE